MPSLVQEQVLVHPAAVGEGVITGEGAGGDEPRGPQSVQSVPREQRLYEAPVPPSSQPPSLGHMHVSVHPLGRGAGGGMVAATMRGPQSLQSVPTEHEVNSAPAPPSSQSPSVA